jgi:TPP-dependent pyruvate/acetoin dehydrogenase alpha subunit
MTLPGLPPDELQAQLRTMLRIRRFEEALILLAQENDIGHYHVYVGQEPTGVPALAFMEEGDVGYTTHRNHGHLIAAGVDPAAMAAEILGKATGTNKGKGGTLHLASAAHGFPTTSSSVGGPLPISVGSAFAFKELGLDRISFSIFGDGALEEGAWHESINIAAMRQVPIIFLCENNSLEALGQQANEYPSSTLAAVELSDLVRPFGVPTIAVDGTDTKAVHDAMAEAVARARSGGGPTFIEARTVRWPGNRPLWPQLLTGETRLEYAWDLKSISGEHAKWWREQDGVLIYLRELLAADVITQEAALKIDTEARKEMANAIRFALESPYPAPEEALEDVYA